MQTPSQAKPPPYSTSPLLDQFDCISHGFFGAQGGISKDKYASLNCGHSSKDDSQKVVENRRRVTACFKLKNEDLYSLRQAHTTKVVEIYKHMPPQYETTADGMVSRDKAVMLGALGADCAPVLYVDPINHIIGAAHSGWRGALDGINEKVIQAMLKLGAELSSISAAIGPAMQKKHYEVKHDFKTQFERLSDISTTPFFHNHKGRLYFDTPAYIYARLEAQEINKIDMSAEDTFSQPDKYFSYRRACKHGLNDYGRQIATISLR